MKWEGVKKCWNFTSKIIRIFRISTFYNQTARNLMETRENIKIESHPFHHIIWDWFLLGWSKKKNSKKNPKRPIFKMAVFQNRQFSIFFVKISWIGPWVKGPIWSEKYWQNFHCQTDMSFFYLKLCRLNFWAFFASSSLQKH